VSGPPVAGAPDQPPRAAGGPPATGGSGDDGRRRRWSTRRTVAVGAALAVVLTLLSMAAVATLGSPALRGSTSYGPRDGYGPGWGHGPGDGPGWGQGPMMGGRGGWSDTCRPSSQLPGHVVDVIVGDHGHMQGPGWGPGDMWIQLRPTSVSAGTVSLWVANHGMRTHELVVLPLPAGARVGERRVNAQDRVDEKGSLGEASTTCGAGAGEEGIAPGAAGWVTLTLPPGRYELVCNLPGHYAAGMYAELTVR